MATDLNDELEALRKTYVAELPAKAGNLSRAVERTVRDLGAGTGHTPNWRELETLSHKLAGSSGTYGFQSLSILSRHLEESLSEGTLQHLEPKEAAEYLELWSGLFAAEIEAAVSGNAPADVSLARLAEKLKRSGRAA